MTPEPSVNPAPSRRIFPLSAGFFSAALLAVIPFALALALATGCEDQGIGRPCVLQAESTENQPTFNGQALECPSRICMKPAKEVAAPVDTVPYCTAECSGDSDCDGQTRDEGISGDRRCKGGFKCGIAAVTGSFCCRKVCICKDFIPPGSVPTPVSCTKENATGTCQNI